MICDICPHNCKIPLGESGKCKVIQNVDNKLENVYAGLCSNMAVEPIEKRPFYHFLPGSKFLSVSGLSCNFSCNFCQNFRVSQNTSAKSVLYSPKQLVNLAEERDVAGIVFTYNEPTLYHEYIEEVGHEIKRRCSDLKLVLKTNGFASFRVIRNLCLYVDAFNVDLKGDNKDYQDVCGGWLEPVLESIQLILQMGVRLEISYLVLPSKIDDILFNVYFRNWLADLTPDVPVHLLYFYPFHKMLVPSYRPSKLTDLADIFREKMNYVYISNHFGFEKYRNTYCKMCGELMIDRKNGVKVCKKECCG